MNAKGSGRCWFSQITRRFLRIRSVRLRVWPGSSADGVTRAENANEVPFDANRGFLTDGQEFDGSTTRISIVDDISASPSLPPPPPHGHVMPSTGLGVRNRAEYRRGWTAVLVRLHQ
ncbi:hypothetical protein GWI33_002214 [Rhynchophorus ferrugineus]|uniref:Uncharacterized protein n=1 Tax=Rhynchophorus ferrugineus TaxID=354439 RepID=A0A834M0V6_RHYFE|nr:hypothetical protein GWI33_002217 [Rhynchophorus ferrugineus]KAF7263491.1 hypothetical protein GWI33_002214 [Rhynchophorus ferrugineus]